MFGFFKKKPEPSAWRTLGVVPTKGHLISDKSDTRIFYYVLFVDQYGNRKIETTNPFQTSRDTCRWMFTSKLYLLNVKPWVEGTLTLEEFIAATPEFEAPQVRK